MRETLNEERSFGSKQAYLTLTLPETLQLRENNAGIWSIEDEGMRISLLLLINSNLSTFE